jgi:hypothetical protein
MPHRSHLLISGDPISLARGAAQIKSALEAELAFYAIHIAQYKKSNTNDDLTHN